MPSLVGFPGGTSGKEQTCQCRRLKRCRFDSRVGKIPWRRKWQPTTVFLPEKSHGQKSLGECSPQICRVRHDWSDLALSHTPSLVGTENTVFFTVWGLTEHRGHLVLLTIKQYLLTANPLKTKKWFGTGIVLGAWVFRVMCAQSH